MGAPCRRRLGRPRRLALGAAVAAGAAAAHSRCHLAAVGTIIMMGSQEAERSNVVGWRECSTNTFTWKAQGIARPVHDSVCDTQDHEPRRSIALRPSSAPHEARSPTCNHPTTLGWLAPSRGSMAFFHPSFHRAICRRDFALMSPREQLPSPQSRHQSLPEAAIFRTS